MNPQSPTSRSAVAIRHVHFEDAGTFGPVLATAGYVLDYADVAAGGLDAIDPLGPDLLIILGGPIGVYDADVYPFIELEMELIRRRLEAGLPLLGICLGAQLIAAVLGARVAATGVKEIGFAPIELTPAGQAGALRHLEGVPVLHWHGDAFEIPDGADLLATTAVANQAFAYGASVLAVQFHPEADGLRGLEAWLIGHAAELAAADVDPRVIRDDARRHGGALARAGGAMLAEWLAQVAAARE